MSETIVVACKLPHGLHLELNGIHIILNGTMSSKNLGKFFMPSKECVGLTKVPLDFWEAWTEKNKSLPQLKKGFIFAHKKEKSALKEAQEKSDLTTGSERIDPKKLPTDVKMIKAGEE